MSMGIATSFFNGLSFGWWIYNPTTGGMVGDRSRRERVRRADRFQSSRPVLAWVCDAVCWHPCQRPVPLLVGCGLVGEVLL